MPARQPRKNKAIRDTYHPEISTSLHRMGITTRVEPTGIFADRQPSSADIICNYNGYGFAIEVKTGHNRSLSFFDGPAGKRAWRAKQRLWARWYRRTTHCEYWLLPVFETPDSPWNVKRDAFLVPFPRAIRTMRKVFSIQYSLPYLAGKGYSLSLQQNKIDAVHEWADLRLEWHKGVWLVPDGHPFREMYIDFPLCLYDERIPHATHF